MENVKFKPCVMQDSCYKIFMLGICTHVNKYLDLKYKYKYKYQVHISGTN